MIENNLQYSKSIHNQGLWSIILARFYPYCVRIKTNPLWLLMFLIGRFRVVGILVISFYKRYQGKSYDLNSSIFQDINVDDVVDSLEKDGIYSGLHLPKNVIQEVLSFASSNNCYGNGKHNCGFNYAEKDKAVQQYGKPFIRGEYCNTTVACAAIKKMANDPKLLEIAHKYLGKVPVLTSSFMYWIFVIKEGDYDLNDAAMNFHYDLNDYRCLRFFFYLTDVDLLSGPHICIRGSHNRKKLSYLLSLFRRQPEAELLDYYGSENILTVCGAAGFGFAEDVFCYHKATPPISQDRLLLQLQFTLHDYGEQTDIVDPALLKRCLPS